jgi:protein-tyrosine phosphatase
MDFSFTNMRNYRDLGGHATSSGKITKYGVFARSDQPKMLTREEIEALRSAGFTTVLDLRTPEETIKFKHPLDGEPGFRYYNRKFDNYLRADFYGPEESAIYYNMLLAYRDNAWAIFTVLAEADGGVVFNCYAGKDRTGTTAALLLMLAGVPDSEIAEDYHKTLANLWPGIEEEKLRKYSLIPHGETMELFIDMFRKKYGDAESYLKLTGLPGSAVERIKAKLI